MLPVRRSGLHPSTAEALLVVDPPRVSEERVVWPPQGLASKVTVDEVPVALSVVAPKPTVLPEVLTVPPLTVSVPMVRLA
jgi:hypothetical protein